MEIKAKVAKTLMVSEVISGKECTIKDCRGDEETGFDYLILVGKKQPLMMWISEDYIVL